MIVLSATVSRCLYQLHILYTLPPLVIINDVNDCAFLGIPFRFIELRLYFGVGVAVLVRFVLLVIKNLLFLTILVTHLLRGSVSLNAMGIYFGCFEIIYFCVILRQSLCLFSR